jgi:hypothetical protein
MAYLREIIIKCNDNHCQKRAVVELVSWDNFSIGKFCRAHGKSLLIKRVKMEAGHE